MSDPALLGVPTVFEFEGRSYPITNPRTFEIEAAFVVWVQAEAYRTLLPHQTLLGLGEFREQVAGWRRDCGAKVYAWGKIATQEALWSDDGLKEMAWQQFSHAQGKLIEKGQPPRDQMSRELVERIFAHPQKGEQLTRLILNLKQEDSDPNAGTLRRNPSAT